MMRSERCACGTTIVARPTLDAIFLAVQRHNESDRHRWWRSLGGLEMVARPASLAVV